MSFRDGYKRFGTRHRVALMGAIGGGGGSSYASDTFTRANSATLGTSSSGHLWTQSGGSNFGITSNKASYSGGGLVAKAVVDDGLTGGLFQFTFGVVDGDQGLLFRFTNTTNYWLAYHTGLNLVLVHITAGVQDALLVNAAQAVVTGDTLGVRVTGNSIQVLFNGANFGSAQTSALEASATKSGLYHFPNAGTATADDFVHSA